MGKIAIPEDWNIIKVEDCFDILDNQRKPLNQNERNTMKGNIPYYGANGVVDYVNEFLFDEDLILIAEDGGNFDEFQTRPIAYKVHGKSWVNNHAHVLKAKNGFYQDYLFYCLEHKNILIWLNGGTRAKLNKGDLEKLPIQTPPLREQRAIAKVLGSMDQAINANNQLIAQKELRKKWLMQNLLTGKKRLKGFSGEWMEVKLGKVFEEIKSVNDGGKNHSVMTISSKLGLISQKDKFDRVIAGDSLKKYTQLRRNDFAYNKGNSKTYPMGCIYQLEEKESALVPFVYICFRPTEAVDALFYKHWFLAYGLDRQLKRIITSGARGDGLLNVNKGDFFKLKTVYPPKEEQTAIAKILQAADKELNLLRAKTDKLKEQKKGMMQVLLTGKKRLKI